MKSAKKIMTMSSTSLMKHSSERIFNLLTYSLMLLVVLSAISILWEKFISNYGNVDVQTDQIFSLDLERIQEVVLSDEFEVSNPRDPNCRMWNCINLYRCGQNGNDHLTIYIYPLHEYIDGNSGKSASILSKEFYQILEAIQLSPYYTSNPKEACLFVPSIDLLNQGSVELDLVGRSLASLDYWDDGRNHILMNMLPGAYPTFNTTIDVHSGQAIIMGGGFNSWSYRNGFDISIPVWSTTLNGFVGSATPLKSIRKYRLISAQLNHLPKQKRILQNLAQDNPADILLLESCRKEQNNKTDVRCSVSATRSQFDYPAVLKTATFCLLSRSFRLGQPDLLDMLAYNCIPVIAIDNYVLPFEDVLDWSLFSIRIRETDIHSVLMKLNSISEKKIMEMVDHGHWVFNKYLKNLETITLTALEILENRIFPHKARSLQSWNTMDSKKFSLTNPLFLPLIAPKSEGFTAVILTYDRVESLFALIKKLALVPSLQCIVVIWNNQRKAPPHLSSYPSISKPLKVIQAPSNKLSNRFFPYAEIETEAILTIDDDIIMLTTDELDFGYEVWREFPDRIVGFPSRIHIWDNVTGKWQYESEWTNQISMVLTGAAFHHKFWSHMYTYYMPGDIKTWVDEHMNCEDIAMNFLVANITKKAPIKVTPRKKFKCPECTNTEMLSADLNHMLERSACIDRFAHIYGMMPLRSVEFRADPVLFKDNFPEKLKRFNDIGSLAHYETLLIFQRARIADKCMA